MSSRPRSRPELKFGGGTRALLGSREYESGKTPRLDTSPYVGFKPTTPQWQAGPRIDPLVSEPKAKGKKPAATATPLPEEDAPGIWSTFHGLRAGGNGRSKLGPPRAYSCVASFPIKTPPPSFSRA